MKDINIKRALIAVYDKTGIADFARALVDEFGIEILSTGGTAKHLKDAGIPVTMVEQVTGFPEMLDGRVKTLHPHIHAAILADRDKPEHMRQLAEHNIKPIDMVVVNLYPFEKTIAKPDCAFEEAIEMIDIGGPCMLRAAAKNHKHVFVWSEARMYGPALLHLRCWDDEQLRRDALIESAQRAFKTTCLYDEAVSKWMSTMGGLAGDHVIRLRELGHLRYGENPDQRAQLLYPTTPSEEPSLPNADERMDESVQMSFNNYVDGDSALSLVKELSRASLSCVGPASCRSSDVGPASSRSQPGNEGWAPVQADDYSRRHLPHLQNPGRTYFVTFRTDNLQLTPEARDSVLAACTYWHGQKMNLHIAVVMPDHVHLLLTPYLLSSGTAVSLTEIIHSIKSYSANDINKIMQRTGAVWVDERWDRIMRSEKEFLETWEYIETNPDRANLGAQYKWVWSSRTEWEETACIEEENRQDAGSTPREEDRLEAGPTQVKASFSVAFIKHTNACGVAIGDDPVDTYKRAYLGDPIAAAGGVLCMNFPVTKEFADVVMNSYRTWGKEAGAAFFKLDVWIAPSFDDDAVKLITTPTEKRKWGASCRLLAVGRMGTAPDPNDLDYKKITGGMLVQTRDLLGLNEEQWKVVSKRRPTEAEMADLRFAWLVCKHTKSNAITIVRDGMLLGNGAGQMSRVKSCDLAVQLARENGHGDQLPGAVAAGDAFFPVEDGPQKLIDAGITAIIHPGGSNRDADTIRVADEANVAMIVTGTRHFKH